MMRLIAPMVALALAACQAAAPLPSLPPPSETADVGPTQAAVAPNGSPSADQETLPGARPCELDERLPPVVDGPGRLPDGLLGTVGGEWGAGENGSFVWRQPGLTMTGMGTPDIVPPRMTHEAAPGADTLVLTLSEPLVFHTWDLVIFPWAAYEDPTVTTVLAEERDEPDGASALCVDSPGPGEWFIANDFWFADGNHLRYRWHLIVPPG